MAYTDKVIDHYENPRNVGTLDKESHNVGTGLVGAPECGDVMKLQVEVDEITRHHQRREVQDLRLRQRDREFVAGDRMDQGQDNRRSACDQEHGYRGRAFASADQDPLLRFGGRRDQGRD